MSATWLWWLAFLSFNMPIAGFLLAVPFGKRLDDVLKEKTPDGTATSATSYSRVTGALGAVILTSFFWAVGNVVLSIALVDAAKIKPLLEGVWPFFLIGSAFFLPYAFNQLKTLFPWTANAAVALAQMDRWTGVNVDATPAPARLIIANLSSIGDAELGAAVAAIQLQIKRDFEPEWGLSTVLVPQRVDKSAPQVDLNAATDAVIYVGDRSQDPDSGVDGVFGYHKTNNPGVPFGFVFHDVCQASREPWSVTLSHEVLELLADPQATARIVGPDPRVPAAPGVAFELEVCDPTQGDSYPIGSVHVANFVTQRYFGRRGRASSTNCMNLPLQPFSARPRGYAQYWDRRGCQILNGDDVTRGQIKARKLMGAARRNARRMQQSAMPEKLETVA